MKVLRIVVGSILLFSIAGCENKYGGSVGVSVCPVSGPLVLSRGQTATVTCYLRGMGGKLSFGSSYVGMVTMSAECTEGIVITPSQWEMEMVKGVGRTQALAELTIAVSDNAPLGSHTVKMVGIKEDGTTTEEKVFELAVTAYSQYETVSQLQELGHKANLNLQGYVVSVTLRSDRFTDKDLEHLDGLTELTHLSLSETKVTDAGLAHLRGLTKLESLYLQDTQITDAGLMHLEGLTKLDHLDLADTQITDAGLVHLKGLTKLDFLNLTGTQITDEGVKKLQQALPNCKIFHRGLQIPGGKQPADDGFFDPLGALGLGRRETSR